MKTHKGY